MRFFRCYITVLLGGLLFLMGTAYVDAYKRYQELAGDLSYTWIHEVAILTICEAIASAAFMLLGLTFIIGLTVSILDSGPSYLTLSPVVLILVIATITTGASVALEWYNVSTGHYSGTIWVATILARTVAIHLGIGLGLGAILVSTVVWKNRQAN